MVSRRKGDILSCQGWANCEGNKQTLSLLYGRIGQDDIAKRRLYHESGIDARGRSGT